MSAFVEGWGLYSECLGIEIGFYTDPYSNFGRLTYAMWRACRLVVDTGIHAMGWTRQQAIDYLASNTALSHHECTTEVDRYISWPGPGARLQDRRAEDPRAARARREGARPSFDVAPSTTRCSRNGSVPLTCSSADRRVHQGRIGTLTRASLGRCLVAAGIRATRLRGRAAFVLRGVIGWCTNTHLFARPA